MVSTEPFLSYLPRNIIGKKLVALLLYSKKYFLVDKVDEAIETNDEIILIERKYSNNHIIGGTTKTQLGLLSILLEENLDKPVNKAFVIFSKAARYIVEFQIDSKIKKFVLDMLHDTKNVFVNGISPYAKFDNRCLNCCYRKICPVRSFKYHSMIFVRHMIKINIFEKYLNVRAKMLKRISPDETSKRQVQYNKD